MGAARRLGRRAKPINGMGNKKITKPMSSSSSAAASSIEASMRAKNGANAHGKAALASGALAIGVSGEGYEWFRAIARARRHRSRARRRRAY